MPVPSRRHRLLFSVVSAASVGALGAERAHAQVIRLDGPVAIVNERVITGRDVAKAARALDGGSETLEARMQRAFQSLLLDAILAQAPKTAAYDERMIDERVKQQTRLREEQEGSRSELQAELARQGDTLEDYRKKQKEDLRRLVLYESLSSKIGPTGRPSAEGYVSPRRMLLWYRRHPQEFREPEAIQARLCVAPFAGDGSEVESRRRAEAWLGELQRGADFAALAKAGSSWNPSGGGELSGDRSGALQWVSAEPNGPLDPELRRAVLGREKGLLPEIVRTVEGYAVVELVAHRPAARRPFEDPAVQREIGERLRRQWAATQERATEDELRAKSYIWLLGQGR
ncbi:MAG: peptidyl-prolyl cis-trans isomerase [Planctomycetes bacterium]|nr:peptidyl-prolyl cis-trans isomerase [Planctomycetota bacterium]